MTRGVGLEVVRELGEDLPPGWRWRPQLVEGGEALSLLQRYEDRGLPESARDEIIKSASNIISRCISPNEATDSQETGLVIGYVQSGKTLSFTTLAALACDNNFPLIIVLSGTKKNLYSQTVKRLRLDLDIEHPAGRWDIFEAQTQNPGLPRELRHLLEQWDQEELPGFPRRTALITVLKNRQRVEGLVRALEHLDLSGRPCLIIDDEADQYGLNTKVRQGEMSPVYRALLSMREAVPRHTYVQYTATPQAMLLINVLDSLSPRFGQVLSEGTGYCGGRDFFGEDGRSLVRTIADHDLRDMDNDSDSGPPTSLLEAMRLFYIGVAVQAVHRGRDEPTQRYRSMLVHPSMHKLDHLRFKRWVEGATESWIELIEFSAEILDRIELIQEFQAAYSDLVATTNDHLSKPGHNESVPEFEHVLKYLPQAMRTTRTWEVNSREVEQWTQENWNSAHSHILVGGENLGRGFTVEGLTTTYMPRGRGTGVADTIQQRGRFFGYKSGYLGLCRVFLPRDVRADYENYLEHETFVMEKLGELSESAHAMSDWRRRMLLAQSLRPTRRSVIPDIYAHRRVSEWTQQTQPWLPSEGVSPEANWPFIDSFLDSLDLSEDPGSDGRTKEQRNARAQGVPLLGVLEDLLVRMSFSQRDAPNFSAAELAIQWFLRSYPDATATVYRMAAYSDPLPGGGTRRRRIDSEGRLANLYQGAAPVEPVRLRGSIYPGDRRIHSEEEVSVQIHDLDLTDDARGPNLLQGHVPTVAVWIPEFMRVAVFEEMAR